MEFGFKSVNSNSVGCPDTKDLISVFFNNLFAAKPYSTNPFKSCGEIRFNATELSVGRPSTYEIEILPAFETAISAVLNDNIKLPFRKFRRDRSPLALLEIFMIFESAIKKAYRRDALVTNEIVIDLLQISCEKYTKTYICDDDRAGGQLDNRLQFGGEGCD